MNFASDNTTGAAPEVMAAIQAANAGRTMPYGNEEASRRAEARIAEVFECQARVFMVATGTASNALALAAMTPPFGAVLCHTESHIEQHECGAPEFFSGGAKLIPLDGADRKLRLDDVRRVLDLPRGVHHVQPAALSLTQATEGGTVYSIDEVAALAEAAHGHGLKVHMDGARLANAVAAIGCAPADVTWRAGVDVLSFGATKNGALAAEAVVVFDQALAETIAYRRKRGGHLFSKMRFLTAQWEAYLEDGRWLRWATHANTMAARLAGGLAAVPGVRLAHPVEANIVFPLMPGALADAIAADGFGFYRWEKDGGALLRLICAFDTRARDVDALIAAAHRHADGRRPAVQPAAQPAVRQNT